jgi:hypothetical protein
MDEGKAAEHLFEPEWVDAQAMKPQLSAKELGGRVIFQLAIFATFNLMDDAAMLAFMFC